MDGATRMAAVSEAAERYYRAMVAGDADGLRALFDPRAVISGHFEGKFDGLDVESFVAEAAGLVGQHGTEACAVECVRVDGDIAAVAVAGRYMHLWIIDHLLLVEVAGRWTIVAKTFHVVA